MNTEKLQKIRAKCFELLAIAEKRTPGEWITKSHNVPIGETGDYEGVEEVEVIGHRESDPVLYSTWNGDDEDAANNAFIASCAGPAEAGWRSTIAAIDVLRGHCLNPNDEGRECLCSECTAVNHIITAWPEELL
jgi:hypothetical protein